MALTPMRRNDLSRETGLLVVWALTVESVGRGLDFIIGSSTGRRAGTGLSVVEASAPLWFWGSFGLLVAVSAAFGVVRSRYEPVIVAGVAGMALYLTYSVGYLAAVVDRGWPPDGFRTPIWFLVMAAMWGAIALEMLAGRSVQRKVLAERREAGDGDTDSTV